MFKNSTGSLGDATAGERLCGKRILVVEDEVSLALTLQIAFEDEGAVVIGPAMSLLQALDVVVHSPDIDAALLDVDLAGDDVYPIAELLLRRGVPFSFHTGYDEHAPLTQLFPDTATLTKPVRSEKLVEHMVGLAG